MTFARLSPVWLSRSWGPGFRLSTGIARRPVGDMPSHHEVPESKHAGILRKLSEIRPAR